MEAVLKKDRLIDLEITGITQEGSGVGRFNGMVVFVPMTAIGDRLKVRVIKVLKNHAQGVVEEIVTPAGSRAKNHCPEYNHCGGCSLRHISYSEECAVKENWLRENMSRIGHLQPEYDPMTPAVSSERYRNKVQYSVARIDGEICTGFYAKNSHDLIPIWDCALQPEIFAEIAVLFRAFLDEKGIDPYDEVSETGLVRSLYLRVSAATGGIMVCIVINGDRLPAERELVSRMIEAFSQIETIVLNINRRRDSVVLDLRERVLYGNGTISDMLAGVGVSLSPQSFYQVNHAGAELLYKKVLEYAAPKKTDVLLDLYCGAGAIGLAMARYVNRVIGVEIVEDAVADARANAARNTITNAEFLCADAAKAVLLLEEKKISPDMVVLDPPRKGVAPETLRCIGRMNPERIVYVSCNSATLARDCALLSELGYETVRAGAVDLFPRTAHCETVVLLSKLKSATSIEVKIDLNEMDLTKSESKATYDKIKAYVLEQTGLKVSQLYIAQVKRKHGIIERENYNTGEGKAKTPQVPLENEKAIEDALRHFQMI